jgi:hypothetical protein
MKHKGLLCFALFFMTTVCWGQKIKYKDLLNLLNAKQYDQAEPFLKKYLADNDDNASAYIFMGIIYQEKVNKNDVLKETEALFNNIDSAILYFDKAYPKVTEKDIKRNDENYQMYTRRDLRTGEFGIKLSDVQLDLESRTKSLREKKEKVATLKKYYLQSESQYGKSNSLYKTIQGSYTNKKELYLQSDDEIIIKLNQLASVFDSCQLTFKNYKTTAQSLGKIGYNQIINLQEIKDFKQDGSSLSYFMEDDLKLWDYTQWAKKTVLKIRDEVFPLRKDLVDFDVEINKLRDKIKKDSTVVATNELKKNRIFDALKNYDSDPMPLQLFDMKLLEMDYASDLMVQASLNVEDVSKKIAHIKSQIGLLNKLDSVADELNKRNWEVESVNYKHFISSAYGTTSVLRNLIKSTQEYCKREIIRKQKELSDSMQLLKWVISETDSIPLFKDVSESSKYRPMVIEETHTSGIKIDSVLTGYFYTVTPSRTADLRVNFPVDTTNITLRNLPLIKGISLSPSDQSFYTLFYSESRVEGKVPVSIAKISRAGGLEWSMIDMFDFTPIEMQFNSATGELLIKTSSDGNSKMVAIDKTGGRIQ